MPSIYESIICQAEGNGLLLMAHLPNTFRLNRVSHRAQSLALCFSSFLLTTWKIALNLQLIFLLMIYSIVENPASTAAVLKNDLELISQWAHQWKMSFSPEPSKQAVEILFSNRKTKTAHPFLFFNGLIVNKVNEHNHLGLTLDSKLSFFQTRQ